MMMVPATPDFRDAVKAFIAGQMADELIGKADLADSKACRASLLATGFGQLSVDALLDSAMALAHAKAA